MTGLFSLPVKAGNLQMSIEKKKRGWHILIVEEDTGFLCRPDEICVEDQTITIITTFYMFPDEQHKAELYYDGSSYICKGSLALGGELRGKATPHKGPTKYDRMAKKLMKLRTGKEIRRTDAEIMEEVEQLLSNMTLEEKIGQMSQSAGKNTAEIGNEIKGDLILEEAIKNGSVGSVISMTSVENLFDYQQIAVEESRLKIPLMFCQDIIHGYQTIFPVPIASACSFSMDIIEESCKVSAREATANGIMFAFSPMLDIARDPRWGRVVEGGGEDPYLVSEIARAQVRGYQGTDLYDQDTMIACLKHFVGYSAAEGGRDYNTTEISETTLHNVYLPPFIAGIEEGAGSVMNSFSVMNGIPVAINKRILKDLLRDKLGFEGILISDYAAVEEAVVHGAAKDDQDAVCKAIHASMDFEMGTGLFNAHLKDLVTEGFVTEEMLDDSVRRILYYKYKSGIMDDPYRYMRPEDQKHVFCLEHLEKCREAGRQSIVMLKNDDFLPIKKKQRIALIGPRADSLDMLGPWQFSRYDQDTITVKEGLVDKGYEVLYAEGCRIHVSTEGGIREAIKVAEQADVVVLVLGEDSSMTGEAASRQDISLPKCQMTLAHEVCKTEKKVLLVLTNGRPIILNGLEEHVDAILETWFLGSQAGNAIADVISGDYNPSGKLAISFPKNQGQIPIYYNHLRTGRPCKPGSTQRFLSRYQDGSNEPLYPFGYGLSYTTFEITNLHVSQKKIYSGGYLNVSVLLKNTGKIEGEEVVQLYIQDIAASIARPFKELKGFKKIRLLPQQEMEVKFTITEEQLGFYNEQNMWCCEEGNFGVMIGNSSADSDLLRAEITYCKGRQINV